jgi:hypothetical protein
MPVVQNLSDVRATAAHDLKPTLSEATEVASRLKPILDPRLVPYRPVKAQHPLVIAVGHPLISGRAAEQHRR